MPRIGAGDLFERQYLAALHRLLAPYGIPLEYKADRAALDGGLHLFTKTDGSGAEVSDVRVWFQCKGLQRTTLSAVELDNRKEVHVSGLAVEHVQFWYGSPEPVYLIVYVEAIDTFLAGDVRDLVDAQGGPAYLRSLRHQGQATLTLRVPLDATLARALKRMPSHRSLRIDGPAFRGRPLGHRYDPLRSQLEKMPPELFDDLVSRLLAAHDFRPRENVDLSSLLDRDVGLLRAQTGTLYLTYEWMFPGATEFGFDEGSDFRIEAEPVSAHGDVLVVSHSRVDEMPRRTTQVERLVDDLRKAGVDRALVFFNEAEMDVPSPFGGWRVTLDPLTDTPQGLGSLAFNVLTTTLVYLEFADRLSWKYLSHL